MWKHVAVTVDVSAITCNFYFDGVEEAGTFILSDAVSIFNGSAPFAIGATETDATPAQLFDGLIDEVRVWNDIRTAGEISANFQTQLVGSESGLVGYWRLNNDYLDETANNNDLTAAGSPVFSTNVPFAGSADTTPGSYAFFM